MLVWIMVCLLDLDFQCAKYTLPLAFLPSFNFIPINAFLIEFLIISLVKIV